MTDENSNEFITEKIKEIYNALYSQYSITYYDGKNYEACDGRPVEGDICIITLDDGTQIAAKYVQFDNYSV